MSRQNQPYRQQEVTGKVGSMPMDGNSQPVRFGKARDPFAGLEEEKYQAPPRGAAAKPQAKKPAPRNPAPRKDLGANEDTGMIMGGGPFGARPILSSQKKTAAAGNIKPPAKVAPKAGNRSARGAPFGGAPDAPIKRGGGMQVPEFANEGSLGKCMYCGRTFNEVSLEKHQNVCQERPGKKKRKVFDSSKHRLVDEEQKSLQAFSKKSKAYSAPKKVPGDMPKWKAMSLEFRNGLKAARRAEQGLPPPVYDGPKGYGMESNFTRCPTCNRSFNPEAAARHIPFCAQKAKEASLRCGGKPKPKAAPRTQKPPSKTAKKR